MYSGRNKIMLTKKFEELSAASLLPDDRIISDKSNCSHWRQIPPRKKLVVGALAQAFLKQYSVLH